MYNFGINPFPTDKDRKEVWEMLMKRDFEAFIKNDWSIVENDFLKNEFVGYHAEFHDNPDLWNIKYPKIGDYRDDWLMQAYELSKVEFKEETKMEFFFRVCHISNIEINVDRAVAHKKFNGSSVTKTGEIIALDWQTLYFLKKVKSTWKISGFLGYLPIKTL